MHRASTGFRLGALRIAGRIYRGEGCLGESGVGLARKTFVEYLLTRIFLLFITLATPFACPSIPSRQVDDPVESPSRIASPLNSWLVRSRADLSCGCQRDRVGLRCR